MRLASLGSGSRGNGTLVSDTGTLLVDCGFAVQQCVERMERLGLTPSDLDGILVTHEHGDHAAGVERLARQFNIPVYLTAGTARALDLEVDVRVISSHRPFVVAGMTVMPVVVPHDAREPVQFVLMSAGGARCGVLTDAGHVTPHMIASYRDCDTLLLEYNHDPQLLWNGSYPPYLKRRVAGPHGHLNNEQSNQLLSAVAGPRLQHVVLAHLSASNNTLLHAHTAATRTLAGRPVEVSHASQEEGTPWIEVTRREQLLEQAEPR